MQQFPQHTRGQFQKVYKKSLNCVIYFHPPTRAHNSPTATQNKTKTCPPRKYQTKAKHVSFRKAQLLTINTENRKIKAGWLWQALRCFFPSLFLKDSGRSVITITLPECASRTSYSSSATTSPPLHSCTYISSFPSVGNILHSRPYIISLRARFVKDRSFVNAVVANIGLVWIMCN